MYCAYYMNISIFKSRCRVMDGIWSMKRDMDKHKARLLLTLSSSH